MHYVWHRSENKHSTSRPPLYPQRHCLSCLYIGPVAWSLWNCLLFATSPGKSHGQWSFACRRKEISFLLAAAFLSIKLSISLTNKNPKTEEGVRGKKKENALQCSYTKVRSRLKGYSFFFSAMLEVVVMSRSSPDPTIPQKVILQQRSQYKASCFCQPQSTFQISKPHKSQWDQIYFYFYLCFSNDFIDLLVKNFNIQLVLNLESN